MAVRPFLTIPAATRSGGASGIGYHLPHSVSVLFGALLPQRITCRSATWREAAAGRASSGGSHTR